MSVVSATGTVRIVRPRRVVRSGEGKWTLLLIGVIAAVLLLWEAAVSWFHWIPAAFLPAPTAVAAALISKSQGRPSATSRPLIEHSSQ